MSSELKSRLTTPGRVQPHNRRGQPISSAPLSSSSIRRSSGDRRRNGPIDRTFVHCVMAPVSARRSVWSATGAGLSQGHGESSRIFSVVASAENGSRFPIASRSSPWRRCFPSGSPMTSTFATGSPPSAGRSGLGSMTGRRRFSFRRREPGRWPPTQERSCRCRSFAQRQSAPRLPLRRT
jgi:hypothetical protein